MPDPANSATKVIDVQLNGRRFRATSNARPGFWQTMARGSWETNTLGVFDAFIDKETVVFDIGAWMGPTTLYAAPRAAHVLSFEPDPVAFAELAHNLRLNADRPWCRRVEAFNKAVGARDGTMRIGSGEGLGQSVSSALYHDADESVEVDVLAFDSLADDPRLNGNRAFIKIDIEGGEYALLQHSSRLLARPDSVLFLSMHPRILRRRERVDSGHSPFAMIRRRLRFVQRHRDVFETLPFAHYYTSDGRPIKLTAEFRRALFLGKFAREIVCTHQPWEEIRTRGSSNRPLPDESSMSDYDLQAA